MVEALPERIEQKIEYEPNSNCWLWSAGAFKAGYGAINVGGRTAYAHRVVYELLKGPIPAGLTLDHLCRVRSCVNPAHLEAVTMAENLSRGVGRSAINARKTHYPAGHPYDLREKAGTRRCRQCVRRRNAVDSLRYYYRRRRRA